MDQPRASFYRRQLAAAVLALLLALPAGAQQPPEKRPEEPRPAAPTAEQLFRDAAKLIGEKQTSRAIDALQRGLRLAPDNMPARLQLADLLLAGGRGSEAATLLRSATPADAALDERLLKALQASASPLELAIAAEAAVGRHPGHPVLLGMAVDALLAVGAHERASGYWQKLPPAERERPAALWQLGRLHEAADRPAAAWAAHSRAAAGEPRARAALQKLAERQLLLDGWRYFPPPGWIILLPDSGLLIERDSGVQARITRQRASTPAQAAAASLAPRLPIAAERLSALLQRPGEATEGPLQLTVSDCLATTAAICVHTGPAKDFAGMLPALHLAALPLGSDVLLVSVDNAAPPAALAALRQLAHAERLHQGDGK
ncbi:tetratricopeptide repeat protein [Azonexus sp.]|uniref:tetratricopeptide repeat protein n=1 Tax=Azonexus sp. TaxID=1872668 RepID=UPI0035B2CE06